MSQYTNYLTEWQAHLATHRKVYMVWSCYIDLGQLPASLKLLHVRAVFSAFVADVDVQLFVFLGYVVFLFDVLY